VKRRSLVDTQDGVSLLLPPALQVTRSSTSVPFGYTHFLYNFDTKEEKKKKEKK
jgi:hypothetical protein